MLRLDGKVCFLQEFAKENLYDPKYFAWLRDLNVMKNIYRLEYLLPIQFAEIENYVIKLIESKNDAFFAIYLKENSDFIGTLKIGHIDWRAGIGDLGIMIGEKKYWGKSIGKDAMSISLRYCFDVLGLRKITAGTISNNIAFKKSAESVGFKIEGVLRKQIFLCGEYFDHLFFGLFKDEFKPYEGQ